MKKHLLTDGEVSDAILKILKIATITQEQRSFQALPEIQLMIWCLPVLWRVKPTLLSQTTRT